jgi:hypothetical protein
VETQRQWADKAIVGTTPALFDLFPIITLLAAGLMEVGKLPARQRAWYAKEQATFSDTLAFVRGSLWSKATSSMWSTKAESRTIPCSLHGRMGQQTQEYPRGIPSSGVCVAHQPTSWRSAGTDTSIFNIGICHSPWHLLRKWLELLLVMVISKYLAGRQIG